MVKSATPIKPSHSTPFKSTFASAQQARNRRAESASIQYDEHTWPPHLQAASLDSSQWTYLAEGGKNLLLRYEGRNEFPFVNACGRKVALRLQKITRGSPDESKAENDDIDAIEWRNSVLQPDLASIAVLPPLIKLYNDTQGKNDVFGSFLKEIAAKIETMRPMERRRTSGLDEMSTSQAIFVTEDLSAAMEGKQIISFEIKPKCGFLPTSTPHLSLETATMKRLYSRYRMHRVFKSKNSPPSLDEFEQFYEPLDLYSEEEQRSNKATKALYDEWEQGYGNLRLFVNGKRTETSEVGKANEIAKIHFQRDSVEALILSVMAGKNVKALLRQLVHLQAKYDDLDIEGVASLYQSAYGKSLGDAQEGSISLKEYQEIVQMDSLATSSPRQAIVKLMLSAMYKDCSIFVRCISGEEASIHLVDLDPKPISKLAYYEELDMQIVQHFQQWAHNVGLPLESAQI